MKTSELQRGQWIECEGELARVVVVGYRGVHVRWANVPSPERAYSWLSPEVLADCRPAAAPGSGARAMNHITRAQDATARLRESVRAILEARGCRFADELVALCDARTLADIGFRELNADGLARRAA
jgi:hypothetical protein